MIRGCATCRTDVVIHSFYPISSIFVDKIPADFLMFHCFNDDKFCLKLGDGCFFAKNNNDLCCLRIC